MHITDYQGILLDAYGVFWGGNDFGVLPRAKEAMEHLVASGKTVVILSNATQLAPNTINKLSKHGLMQGQHFHFLVTSGEVARSVFLNEQLPFPTPKKKFWLFGGIHPKFSSPLTLFENSAYTETKDLSEADFIYIAIPHIDGIDQTKPEIFHNEVQQIKEMQIPMVCANPDKFAQEGTPPRPVVRQGCIAALYEKLGGQVFYTGKPYSLAYDTAIKKFQQYGITENIIMVGDNPETDIRGANKYGIDSCLITETGLMAGKPTTNLPSSDTPTMFIKSLGAIL
jgi:HAD superfamily hydrolase (TIGR01459 family)